MTQFYHTPPHQTCLTSTTTKLTLGIPEPQTPELAIYTHPRIHSYPSPHLPKVIAKWRVATVSGSLLIILHSGVYRHGEECTVSAALFPPPSSDSALDPDDDDDGDDDEETDDEADGPADAVTRCTTLIPLALSARTLAPVIALAARNQLLTTLLVRCFISFTLIQTQMVGRDKGGEDDVDVSEGKEPVGAPAPAFSLFTERPDLPSHSRLTSLSTTLHSTPTLPFPITDNQFNDNPESTALGRSVLSVLLLFHSPDSDSGSDDDDGDEASAAVANPDEGTVVIAQPLSPSPSLSVLTLVPFFVFVVKTDPLIALIVRPSTPPPLRPHPSAGRLEGTKAERKTLEQIKARNR
ncbi:hypothetical protein GYMLUDRAFT_248662 [Collybiopsis luxurians FD-317 M1]|uniref:Uncharacterized protein n=1 Tax=Collybiopsis luxurians FD-317 M1 TaxID=944289 RepID=A0A0D0AXR8_9AGAR|nr:hypothetical protein GYMLUDRAFT_248662 [Collybiopsis luxurians FD-317 M1]